MIGVELCTLNCTYPGATDGYRDEDSRDYRTARRGLVVLGIALGVLSGCFALIDFDFDDSRPPVVLEAEAPDAIVTVKCDLPNTTACGVACVDLRISTEHCGECNHPCGDTCEDGQCGKGEIVDFAASKGLGHGCIVTRAGTVWCWGSNINGELGQDPTKSALCPKRQGLRGTTEAHRRIHRCDEESRSAIHSRVPSRTTTRCGAGVSTVEGSSVTQQARMETSP